MNVVPIGPIHPVLKEPLRIKLLVEGENVVGAELDMGYVHRGIEKIMEGKHYLKCIHLAERVCGICSYIHTQTFAECIENISKIEVPDKARYLRVITCELERIHSHLIAAAVYDLAIEHETLAMWILNAREHIMDILESITGNRVNMGFNVVGGVRTDLNKELLDNIYKKLDEFKEDIKNIIEAFETGPMIALRGKGIGVLGYKEIMKTRAVGPIARASGLPESDWRLRHPIYKELGFKPVWRNEGDNFARMMVRHEEIITSLDLIMKALELYEECTGPVRNKADIKGGEGGWKNEAHRGEVLYKIAITDGGLIKRILIRTPTVMNLEAYKYMLKTCPTISDAVATYTSIDPCVSCTERTIVIKDKKTGKERGYKF
ncbi:MAG: energy-converting hydrogenase subunit [Methanothermococcus sp.]|jgi:energy-converting hydrogenase A subunit O|uniref:hydrogenase large subunit n=1 Tax=Methanothermococcus TaxID=155862 RepID=UPI00037EB29B|nr:MULTISPECIES: nickel-dependent hydrogenase large subunit [Methanothermococcus]MDK2789725.1 energy-converting hydrogenase subunit [Methanothermococcus sp.]MDK2986940.1 energy-converting hydrogenase subunit [Methanothermococcus sp.]